jgi:hypothetical protein
MSSASPRDLTSSTPLTSSPAVSSRSRRGAAGDAPSTRWTTIAAVPFDDIGSWLQAQIGAMGAATPAPPSLAGGGGGGTAPGQKTPGVPVDDSV